MKRAERSLALDVLRGIALLLVVAGRHTYPCPRELNAPLAWITERFYTAGWVGVDLFFVLSGFLVSGLLFRERQRFGRISLPSFFARRGLRIYPPFFFLLLATLVHSLLRGAPIDWGQYALNALFLHNYTGPIWLHTWSLAVEEHFYVLLPLLLLALGRLRRGSDDPYRDLPWLFALLALGSFVLRLDLALARPYEHSVHYHPTHLRMDSLMMGVLVAWAWHYRRERFERVARRLRPWLIVGGLACYLPAAFLPLGENLFIHTAGYTLFFLAGAQWVAAACVSELPPNPFVRALAFVGSHSYSIFLWHWLLIPWAGPYVLQHLDPFHGSGWYLYAPLYVASSIALGVLASWLVEMPVLRLRDRLWPSRGAAR